MPTGNSTPVPTAGIRPVTTPLLSNRNGVQTRIRTFQPDAVYHFSFNQPGHDAVFASRLGRGEAGAVKAMGFLAEHYLREGYLANPEVVKAEMDDLGGKLERAKEIPSEDDDYHDLALRYAHHSFLSELVSSDGWATLDPHAEIRDARAATLVLPGQKHDTLTVLTNFFWGLDDDAWLHFEITELDILS